MINLSKSGNTIVFEFVNNGHYLQNGTIEVPVNSLTLVTDGSDMFTLKKSATNDIFVSGLYSEIGMTKSELETFYKENMVGSTGGGGVPESAFTAYTASTDSRIAEDEEVTAAAFNEIEGRIAEDEEVTAAALNALNEEISGKVETSAFTAYSATVETALSGKQDTLSAGTNITISGNVISAEGGGKAVSGGTNISITTGETADTINCTLPIKINNSHSIVIPNNTNNSVRGSYNFVGGSYCNITNYQSGADPEYAFCYGRYNNVYTEAETAFGKFNVSRRNQNVGGTSATTIFTVGNGTSNNARHNAFEIRQNGDIYLSSGGTDIKLQDYLGGSSITVDTALDSGSTNPVENRVIYNKFDEVEQVTAAALNALNDTIGNINSILESIKDMATIAENLNRIQSAKTDIRTAIEAKGVTVPSSATIDTYDTYVSQISGGMPMPSKLSSASFNDYGLITSAEIKSGATSIGENAFYGVLSLQSITIPDTVTSIDNSSFYNCGSLSSIDIPDSVTSIGGSAFQGCTGLTSCTIGSGITSIGIGAFANCSGLTSVTINATVPPTLNSGAFYGSTCPIYVPAASLTAYQSADGWEDYRTRIQAIPAPSSPKWIATYSGGTTASAECDSSSAITQNEINGTNLVSIEIGDCVTSIGESAFHFYTVFTSCTIGSGVTSIGNSAFYRCNGLTSIDIPDSVTSIGDNAFYQCIGLTSCTIGSGVTSIGYTAFRNCTSLTSITVNATTPPTLVGYTFDKTNNCPIYVPASSLSAYQSAWSSYASRIQAIS